MARHHHLLDSVPDDISELLGDLAQRSQWELGLLEQEALARVHDLGALLALAKARHQVIHRAYVGARLHRGRS